MEISKNKFVGILVSLLILGVIIDISNLMMGIHIFGFGFALPLAGFISMRIIKKINVLKFFIPLVFILSMFIVMEILFNLYIGFNNASQSSEFGMFAAYAFIFSFFFSIIIGLLCGLFFIFNRKSE